MKLKIVILLSILCVNCKAQLNNATNKSLFGNRFLTLNAVIRVNQIEVSRNRNLGNDERELHIPTRVIKFREAVEEGLPGSKITWALSWLALHDTTQEYEQIRKLVVGYHYKYGDDITFIPGAYFANAYNSVQQVNKDLHEGLIKVSEIVGKGYRSLSVVAVFFHLRTKNTSQKRKVFMFARETYGVNMPLITRMEMDRYRIHIIHKKSIFVNLHKEGRNVFS